MQLERWIVNFEMIALIEQPVVDGGLVVIAVTISA